MYGEETPQTDLSKYYEFKTEIEASKWGYGIYKEWGERHKAVYSRVRQKYSYSEALEAFKVEEPLARYYGNEYERLNDYLRNGSALDEKDEAVMSMYIREITLAIFSTPIINQDIVVFRQVPDSMIRQLVDKNKCGLPYTEKGFLSTSLVKDVCINNCGINKNILKIYVPKGYFAIYANVIAKRNEQELLFPPVTVMDLINYPFEYNNRIIYEVMLRPNRL